MISFVIPAYNEELELPLTIAAIREAAAQVQELAPTNPSPGGGDELGLWRDRKYEIIVVDDASTDSTAEVARRFGARVVPISRRQIAAARNAGVDAARGDILLFVDSDTHINAKHVAGAIAALAAGYSGGGARVAVGGAIPLWSRVFLKVFCTIYFGLNLAAGAFLFTTRRNFDAIGGLDEELFIGEEIFFSLALRKIGRFKILREPIVTSGRKLRMYSGREILMNMFALMIGGMRAARSRDKLDIWYNGKRETTPPAGRTHSAASSAFAASLQHDKSR
jgi:glycosyltransferase involved in cell wall biosynthesis